MNHKFIRKLLLIAFFLITLSSFARHNLAPEYCCTTIKTTQGDQFHIYSPALNYTGDVRIKGYRLYLSASTLLPLWARQENEDFYNPDFYSHVVGTDLFIGLARDVPVIDKFGLIPVFGWHLNGILLRGKSQYMDFFH